MRFVRNGVSLHDFVSVLNK
jgi:hypothetical protein